MSKKSKRQFGRLHVRDARDDAHPMRRAIGKPKQIRTARFWNDQGWWGNQLDRPWCVAYSWLHWLEDGPIGQKGRAPVMQPAKLYQAAQEVDEWPGNDYDGTTVRAGAKVLQAKGFIASYLWAATIQDIVDALLYVGPIVIGSNWTEGMMSPDRTHRIAPTGEILGGHAYVLNGVNAQSGKVRLKNSWGRGWGDNGRAWLSIDDVAFLLAAEGEACLATEVAV